MRKYRIVNKNKRYKEVYGYLIIDENMMSGELYFAKGLKYATHGGVLLRMMHNKCKSSKADDWMFRDWISDRVCPSGRHNINDILKGYNMKEYNPIELCVKRKGECVNDDMILEKLPDDYDFREDLWVD